MSSFNKCSDIELIDLLKSGDHAAYQEVYNRYYATLYLHAYKRLQDREECRDIIQELFTNLWLKRDKLEINNQLSGYLYTAVRNRIFDLLAKKKVKITYLSSLREFSLTYDTDHRARQNQLKDIIDQEIAALPARTREIFELSRKGFFTHKEIALQLNLSEQTVKSTVNNALKVLRVKLGTMFILL
jgi:RNA polymerase sigma-70 factor (family 1)